MAEYTIFLMLSLKIIYGSEKVNPTMYPIPIP
jgi:hypothetical protein